MKKILIILLIVLSILCFSIALATEEEGEVYYNVQTSTDVISHMTPNVMTARISSDDFDAEEGIPAGEELTYNVVADDVLYYIERETKTAVVGCRNVPITAEVIYTWTETVSDGQTTYQEMRTKRATAKSTFTYETQRSAKGVSVANYFPVESALVEARQNNQILKPEYSEEYQNILTTDGRIKLSGVTGPGPNPAKASAKKPNINESGEYVSTSYQVDSEPSQSEVQAAANALLEMKKSALGNMINGCVQAKDGSFSWRGMTQNSGVPAITQVSVKVEGQKIPSEFADGTYIGDGNVRYTGLSNFQFTTPYPNDVVIIPPEEKGEVYYNVQTSTDVISHMTPNVMTAQISSDDFDVEEGIPAGEELTYNVVADDVLYYIERETKTAVVGCRNVPITAEVIFTWTETVSDGQTTYQVTKTKEATAKDTFSYETQRSAKGVPVANYYPVVSALVEAVQNDQILKPEYSEENQNILTTDGRIKLSGVTGPGPNPATVNVTKPSINESGEYLSMSYQVNSEPSQAEMQEAANALLERIRSQLRSKINNCVQAKNGSFSWRGMTQDSGVPTIMQVSAKVEGQKIPLEFADGTYSGDGNVRYTGLSDFQFADPYPNDVVIIPSYSLGDVDYNGVIDISDIRLIIQAYINSDDNQIWSSKDLATMDMNEDGKIDIYDIRLVIQKFIAS